MRMFCRSRVTFLSVALIAVLALFSLAPAFASETQTEKVTLKDWEGTHLSRSPYWNEKKAVPFFEKLSEACKAIGKDFSVQDVIDKTKLMYYTDFSKLEVSGNTVTFFSPVDWVAPVKVTYEYRGEICKDGTSWYAFEGIDVNAFSNAYRYLLMIKFHGHDKGQKHAHMRYGSAGFAQLINDPALSNWWPTIQLSDFNFDQYLENLKPEKMAKWVK
ncbi:MAG: hypothetical protein CSA35_02420 [Dethiosulfovibrio peptidovorans]|nr:MAG: hypothetical protein CSA35_02420 [Dethiosulfovibrio peptidovorans]